MNKFERPELDLRAALRIVRQNLALILLPIVALTGLQLGLALRETPLYSASTELLLQPKSTETLGSGVSNANTVQSYELSRVLATEIRVLESETVADRAAKKLGFSAFASGSTSGESDIITVHAVDADPDRAATVANTFAAEYITFRREQSVRDLTDASRELQAKADRYQKDIDAVNAQLVDPIALDAPTRAALELKRDGLVRQQQVYTTRIDGLALDVALKSGGASVLTPAYPSSAPISPRPMRSAILGMFLGLMLGLGLAFLREFLDDRIKTRDDIVALAAGKPVLGLIPSFKHKKRSKKVEKVASMERHPTFMGGVLPPEAAEAYRSLRTSIQFVAIDRPIRVIQVTSSNGGEGKTTTVTNLALAFARSGLSVMVVDGDLRRPDLHHSFGIANEVGFSSVLSGALGIAKASQFIDGIDDITVLPSGPIPPNPAELLGSERARAVIAAILAHFDIVLIDGPPVLPVVDAVVLSQLVDATLVVARAGRSTRADLASTIETLMQANAPIAGFILNSVPRARRYGYGRYKDTTYGYGYGAGAPSRPRKAPSAPTTKTSAVWVPDDSAIWNETEGLASRSRPYSGRSEPVSAHSPARSESPTPALADDTFVPENAVPIVDAPPDVPLVDLTADHEFSAVDLAPTENSAASGLPGADSTLDGSEPAVSIDTPRDTSIDTPRDTSTDTPIDTPRDTPRDTSTDTPRDTSIDTPTDTATDTPRDTATDTSPGHDDHVLTPSVRQIERTGFAMPTNGAVRLPVVPVVSGLRPWNGNHPINGNHPANSGVLRDATLLPRLRTGEFLDSDRSIHGAGAPTIERERIVPSAPDTPTE